MSVSPDSLVRPGIPDGWRRVDDALQRMHPEAPWSWLLETGSLTRRLQATCRDGFTLDVLDEREIALDAREALLLGLAAGSATCAREVHLSCGGKPCVYARSLLPLQTLNSGGRYLAGLGGRPLGGALFTDPSLERGPIEVIRLEVTDALHAHTGVDCDAVVWGRRSVFRTGGSPLLVSEFFLPGLAACSG